jgi:nucleotide-binding universal stress UspA family protein
MRKILVPTDFSDASKAGMRFAVQLAGQINVEPVFFHCFQALVPTTIHRETVLAEVMNQTQVHQEKLKEFVGDLHKSMRVIPGLHSYAIEEGFSATEAILHYVRQHPIDFICMSTRGAGTVRKVFGTHTTRVIAQSPVPVWAIPQTYHSQPIRKLLYATDLEDVDQEMATVMDLADEVNARVDLVHFFYDEEIRLDRRTVTGIWKQTYARIDRVYFETADPGAELDDLLSKLVKKVRPDLVVFFTHPNHTWFDRFFGDSCAEIYSFVARVPMLVFRKVGVGTGMIVL